MSFARDSVDVKSLVDGLNFAEKVERSLRLIREAYDEFGLRHAREIPTQGLNASETNPLHPPRCGAQRSA